MAECLLWNEDANATKQTRLINDNTGGPIVAGRAPAERKLLERHDVANCVGRDSEERSAVRPPYPHRHTESGDKCGAGCDARPAQHKEMAPTARGSQGQMSARQSVGFRLILGITLSSRNVSAGVSLPSHRP